MIKTVVREHHWSPEKIDDLYFDDDEYHGLIFWYDDVIESIKDLKRKN